VFSVMAKTRKSSGILEVTQLLHLTERARCQKIE
jgi:hypothetical protein